MGLKGKIINTHSFGDLGCGTAKWTVRRAVMWTQDENLGGGGVEHLTGLIHLKSS